MIFFENWKELGRIALTAPIVYLAVIFFIRISGKRSTSQMNNFDWIVTVAMGSIVGSAILLKDVVVIEALFAVGTLLLLQFLVTTLTCRIPFIADAVQADPRILFLNGTFCRQTMKAERVNEQEIRSAVREAGISDLSEVGAVILEADANISVLAANTKSEFPILQGIRTDPP